MASKYINTLFPTENNPLLWKSHLSKILQLIGTLGKKSQ